MSLNVNRENLLSISFLGEWPDKKESSRIFFNGSGLIMDYSGKKTIAIERDQTPLRAFKNLLRKKICEGNEPLNFPPLNPAENPRVICLIEANTELLHPVHEISIWLSACLFADIDPEEQIIEYLLKRIIAESSLFQKWKGVIDPEALEVFLAKVKSEGGDRCCWRQFAIDGENQWQILLLRGDPGAKAIEFYGRPEGFSENIEYPPELGSGAPIEGIAIGRPSVNSALLRNGETVINF